MVRLDAFTSVREGDDLWPHMAGPGELLVRTTPEGAPWAFSLRCPCGCDSAIMVPSAQAVGQHHPFWVLTHEEDGTYSAAPSILMTAPEGCKSHYWIRRNRIDWC